MASAHTLSGLTKWLQRDEWMTEFLEVMAKHVGKACAEHGLQQRDLPAALGEAGYMNVWGCVLEDFMTRTFDDGRNLVEDYLKRRGWKESPGAKRYMAALRRSLMSLYEVVDVTPGEFFIARDLVRGGDALRVHERSGTKRLKKWDRIGARLVADGGKTRLSGVILVFDRDTSDGLLRHMKEAIAHFPKAREAVRDELELEGDDPVLAQFASPLDALRFAGPVFTQTWLTDFLDKALDARPRRIENSDGDEIFFTTFRFPLASGVDGAQVRAALATLEALEPASDDFWNWIKRDGAPISSAGQREKNDRAIVFNSTLEDGSIRLGTIELKDDALVFQANSTRRAGAGRAMLEAALGPLVGAPDVETKTIEELRREPRVEESEEAPRIALEESRSAAHAYLERTYRRQLDEPIPFLGGLSPREAARSGESREKLVDWLKMLENRMAHFADDEPMAGYKTAWMWKELGVSELRCRD